MKKRMTILGSLFSLLAASAFAQDQGGVRLQCGSSKMKPFDTYITNDEYSSIISGKPLSWPLAKTEIYFVKENFPLIMINDSAEGIRDVLSCDKVN